MIIQLLKPGGRAAVVLPDGSLFGEGIKTRLKEHLLQECNLHTIVRLPNSAFRPYASIGTNLLFFEKGKPTGEIWFYDHHVPDGQKAYSMTKPIKIEHLKPCIDWWGGAERQGRVENEVAWRVNFHALLEDARLRARPHWDEAEKAASQASAIKGQVSALRSQIKELEKTRDEHKGSKERQKIETRLRAQNTRLQHLTKELGDAEEKQRVAKRMGDGIYDAVFNLDFKNPHTVADEHNDPDELLARLDEAEQQAAVLRDQLKAILAEALLR